MATSDRDVRWMRKALAQAKKGLGRTRPNPVVGAVLVKRGKVVGTGWHRKAGDPHAEIGALGQAGAKANGATLYVNLEPCSHAGRTGPCTQAIVDAGVKRVVVAMSDPNPQENGRGLRRLKRSDIDVAVGVLEEDARRLNEAFACFITAHRPFVSLKSALTLDGKIATSTGSSKWVTGAEARAEGHKLRDRVDAILVGIETALNDDPALTARLPKRRERAPIRVVLDSKLRLSPRARMLRKLDEADRTVIFSGPNPDPSKALRLIDAGAEIVEVARTPAGLDLNEVLTDLAARDVMHLLVEGGASVATSFLRFQLVDKLHVFIAPKLVGDDGRAAVGPLGVSEISGALKLDRVESRRLGDDLLLEGYPDYAGAAAARKKGGGRGGRQVVGVDDDAQELALPAVAVASPGLIVHRG